jgi:predicted phosphodiesterase
LRADGTLTLACVADTHSQPHPATIARLAAIAPDAILHAGDIGDDAVIAALAATAPVYAVRGNIDTPSTFPDVFTIDVTGDATGDATGDVTGDATGDATRDAADDTARPVRRLRIFMTHIAVAGPRLRAEVARMARTDHAQLVVCRFQRPIVLGTVKITPTSVRLAHIDCETGQPWSPP